MLLIVCNPFFFLSVRQQSSIFFVVPLFINQALHEVGRGVENSRKYTQRGDLEHKLYHLIMAVFTARTPK